MAISLPLPEPWASQGWKVKIRDKERLEPPHVTIIHRTRAWRLNLRTGDFMDKEPDPADVPSGLLDEVRAQRALLEREWDRIYPTNPVQRHEVDDE